MQLEGQPPRPPPGSGVSLGGFGRLLDVRDSAFTISILKHPCQSRQRTAEKRGNWHSPSSSSLGKMCARLIRVRTDSPLSYPHKVHKLAHRTALIVAGALLMPVWISHAAGVLGEMWQNVSTTTNASIIPSGVPDAEFYSIGISYDSRITGYTPNLFLGNPGFFNSSQTFDPTGSFDNTYIRFTGQTYLNSGVNTFFVPHDDGVTLNIAGIGLVLDQPGPTSPVSTTFDVTAPSAMLYDFTLLYCECLGPPAVLVFSVNGVIVGVPEPGSVLLLSAGGFGLRVALRRRKRK